jgi:hypothetical protein
VSVFGQEFSELEASLGSIEQLQRVAGLLAVLHAALLEGNTRISRGKLIGLKAKFERLAVVICGLQRAVGQQIRAIEGAVTDVN